MFSIYNKPLIILFIIFTISDINNIIKKDRNNYYSVEKQVGTYNDIVFLAVIIMFILEKIRVLSLNNNIVIYLMNFLMMLNYCGFTKTILQTLYRVKFILLNDDSALSREVEFKSFTKRVLTIIPYLFLIIIFRLLLFSKEPLFTSHLIGSLLILIITKSLSRANFKVSIFTSELKDNQ